MLNIVKILKSIKLDSELLTPEEAKEAARMIKTNLLKKDQRWMSCENERPYRTMLCLIGYSDGEVHTGKYVHNSDFDRGGFFTSMKEFDLESIGEPVYWMPIPELPIIPSRVA